MDYYVFGADERDTNRTSCSAKTELVKGVKTVSSGLSEGGPSAAGSGAGWRQWWMLMAATSRDGEHRMWADDRFLNFEIRRGVGEDIELLITEAKVSTLSRTPCVGMRLSKRIGRQLLKNTEITRGSQTPVLMGKKKMSRLSVES